MVHILGYCFTKRDQFRFKFSWMVCHGTRARKQVTVNYLISSTNEERSGKYGIIINQTLWYVPEQRYHGLATVSLRLDVGLSQMQEAL